jgi:hypothetical protein
MLPGLEQKVTEQEDRAPLKTVEKVPTGREPRHTEHRAVALLLGSAQAEN